MLSSVLLSVGSVYLCLIPVSQSDNECSHLNLPMDSHRTGDWESLESIHPVFNFHSEQNPKAFLKLPGTSEKETQNTQQTRLGV